MTLKSLKPAVSKTWLIALAGLMWSVVGLVLCRLAYYWLAVIHWKGAVPLELLGIVLALMAHQFCFSRIAQKNIARLSLLTEKTCIFAFQRWKSYFLIGLMILSCSGFPLRDARPRGVYHRVKSGETLSAIARAYRVDLQELAEINNISHSDRIETDSVIFVPDANQNLDGIMIAARPREPS